MRTNIAIAAVLLACSGLAHGQSAANTSWDSPLPVEMADTAPFREVRIPPWVEEMTRLTYCFSVSDAAARDRAERAGSEMSEMGFVNPIYVNYESKCLHKRDPGLPSDSIEKEIADYKRRHVRILAVVPPGLQSEVYAAHPEWRKISVNSTTIPAVDTKKDPVGGSLCLLGPWGDRLIDILCEILAKYPDVDAFSFDGLHHAGVCYCANCRANYLRDTGREIPNADMNDLAFRRFVVWQDRRLEELIERMQTRLKAIKPEVALVTWTTNAGRFGHFLDIPRNMSARTNLLFDAPDQEFWMDETNRGNTLIPAFANAVIWAASNHRVAFSSPYLFSHGNPYGPDSFPPDEVLRRMLLTITYGARPSLALAQPPALQPAAYKSLEEIKKRAPWMTHVEPERWAALLLSDNTRVFYGRSSGSMEERYLANVLGVFRTAVEEHLPVTVIEDWNLNEADLARYKVLILPNAACLSTTQLGAIRTFVRNGGGLVASLDTSLCDEMGEAHSDFALGDVLGVHYAQAVPASGARRDEPLDFNFARGLDAEYWVHRKGIFQFKPAPGKLGSDPRLAEYIGSGPVTFKGRANTVSIFGTAGTAGSFAASSIASPDWMPAIVTNSFGKGRVVYFAAGFDSAYYLYSYPYQRLLIADAIKFVAPAPFPISVTAPMCVHATFALQTNKAGSRLIVHLFNDVNTTGGHAKRRMTFRCGKR